VVSTGSTSEGQVATGTAVRTYLDHLSVERGLAANTLTSYRRDLRRYLQFLGQSGIEDLDGISEATVSGFLMRLREGDGEHPPLSSTSAARTLVAVRGFHKFAVRDGMTETDPAGAAVDHYLVRGRPELVSTGSATGRAPASTGGALFLNARGGRLSRQSAWAVLVRAAERAGVTRDVSPHTLRHSFATHLLDGGADVRVVQELLGHASVTTTQVYTLVTVENLREVFATAHPRARE
jgi:site-specific recombinase XerD